MDIHTVAFLFNGKRLPLQSEKELQVAMEQVFIAAQVDYQREVALSKGSIIDFMVQGVGIEVKLKSSPKVIFEQLLRYCQFEEVKAIILVTNKIIKLPGTINKKPTCVINLGQAWL